MKIGIVVFTDFPEGSAAARRVLLLGRWLVERGHRVVAIVPHKFSPGPLIASIHGVEVRWGLRTTLKASHSLKTRLAARQAALSMVNKLAQEGLDWLIIYNLGLEGVPLFFAARRHGVLVATEYCDIRVLPRDPNAVAFAQYFWQRAGDHLLPRLSHVNITISRYLQKWLQAIAPKTTTVIIPPLVNVDLFQYDAPGAVAFRKCWGIGDLPLISYLGGYWNVDGVAVLLRAASLLAANGDTFKDAISGSMLPGRDCDDVARLVDELGLHDRVVQTNWLPTDQVIAAMSAADVLVVPKIDHPANKAGVPTKLGEYLAVQRPVVSSRVGDIPLYLSDAHDALLCPPGDPIQLAEALRKLFNNQDLRARLGTNGRQAALRYFDYRNAAGQLEMALQGKRALVL